MAWQYPKAETGLEFVTEAQSIKLINHCCYVYIAVSVLLSVINSIRFTNRGPFH